MADLKSSSDDIGISSTIENVKGSPDPTLQIYLDFAAQTDEWKATNSKKLLRKVDFRLLPLLVAMYLLNFLDRSNLAQARLGTLEADLGMGGNDFNLATSILFVVCAPSHLLGNDVNFLRATFSCNYHPIFFSPE
jgi:hypothetical protein